MAKNLNRTVIVTGGNIGLGFAVAQRLCELSYDVVISTRDDTKGEDAISKIKELVPSASIMYLTMELTDPDSIRSFVDKFHETGKTLYCLINNAGMHKSFHDTTRYSARGLETLELTMTSNCMGPFLLTNLLLGDLKACATTEHPSKIMNVSSRIFQHDVETREWKFDIDDLMYEKPGNYHNGRQAYACSKIALNLWSIKLAEQLKESNVLLNMICPGFIPSTGLVREARKSFIGRVFMAVLDTFVGRQFFDSEPIEVGVKWMVDMVENDRYTQTAGLFYGEGEVNEQPDEVKSEENQNKIWSLCVNYSELKS